MAEIGLFIGDKYEIIKKIGQGGMSIVYLAVDKKLNKEWAVKEIKKLANSKNSEVVVQSLLAEANLIKRLDHPALPRIVDVIDDGKTIYLIMDYIEGKPLDWILNKQGAQKQEDVINWAKQLCAVLNYLHNQKPAIIYRDMKPANIMLKSDGTIKVIDFGIAREYKEENIADTISLGTKGYAAPEQFGGNGQTDARTDIYCLGVTLYHLVTGMNPCEPPYEMYPIRHWNAELSVGFEKIIQKCTQPNPNDRYQSCAQLMYALERYERFDNSEKRKKKRKLASFIISLTVAIVFALIGIVCSSIYAYSLAGISFLFAIVFFVVFGVKDLIKNPTTKLTTKANQNEPDNNETTLLNNDFGDTAILKEQEETFEGTQLLENDEDLKPQLYEDGTTILREDDTTILENEHIKNIYKDFEIVESITIIHTKEEIA